MTVFALLSGQSLEKLDPHARPGFQGREEDVFILGMMPMAVSAKPIESRDAECCCEIAVRATTAVFVDDLPARRFVASSAVAAGRVESVGTFVLPCSAA